MNTPFSNNKQVSISKTVKRILCVLLLFCLIPWTVFPSEANAKTIDVNNAEKVSDRIPQNGKDIKIEEKAGIVMDAHTGEILYNKNGSHKYYPASCTKILTALVVLENCDDLSKVMTVKKDAVYGIDPESSHIALDVGEKITVEQALYGLCLASANDCAVVLADEIGGDQEGFAKMMNEKIKELGLKNTHYVTPHGLYDKDHYTTPEDLARIMQAAIQNPTYVKIFSTIQYKIPKTNKSKKRILWNNHRMVKTKFFYHPAVIGGKSGYITKSGFNLVTVGEQNDTDLIVVLLNGINGDQLAKDTKTLLDYYLNRYKTVPLKNTTKSLTINNVKGVPVKGSDTLYALVPKDTAESDIKTVVKVKEVSLPIKKGEAVATMSAQVHGKTVSSMHLYSAKRISFFASKPVRIAATGVISLVAILLILFLQRKIKKISKKTPKKKSKK